MPVGLGQRQRLAQRQALSPQMRHGLKLLERDIGELREELYRELAQNPVFEDIGQPASPHTTGEVEHEQDGADRADASDWPDDDDDAYQSRDRSAATADDIERRERFMNSRTRPETLAEHLRAQLGMAGLDDHERECAIALIGSLDDDGRFSGSFADLVMVTGESEKKLREILRVIMTLDPPGCGATTLQECLLAQLDKLGDSPYRDDVAELIAHHLDHLARRDYAAITAATGMSDERIDDCVELIRTLEPHPGRGYEHSGPGEEIVVPEIHAVKREGRWVAIVDERDLPEIHVSKSYMAMLADPSTSREVRDYIRAKLAAVEELRFAIEHRYDTIRAIAQAIFDAQSEFFERGAEALKPLTMNEIAEKVGVHHSTVSRTVNGKYASTPFGVVELRSFFLAALQTADGSTVATRKVMDRIKELIDEEDGAAPLSDDRIAALLAGEGYRVARRTVAKYRTRLGIPTAAERAVKP